MKNLFQKLKELFQKELMLSVSLLAAVISLFITPPSAALLKDIDWKTLATLFMMLTVLEGFKKENIFLPLIRLSSGFATMAGISLFVVFGVFFTSMFVTNDVSLIIFVPLTILLFRSGGKEHYILPVISMENIAAIRGSMLMPFGSPQNLFIFSRSGVPVGKFILHMFPLSAFSAVLLVLFVKFLYRKEPGEKIALSRETTDSTWAPEKKRRRITYLILFAMIIATIVTRTTLWPYMALLVAVVIFFTDRELLKQTDYVLLLTFLCFFVFSSSIAANPGISEFLKGSVSEHEFWWAIGLSQIISNVPASIVLWPFTTNMAALLYGADTAGLCSIIGSLASVINYRIYVREYPGNGGKFLKTFTLISWAFFLIVVIPGMLLCKWRF